MGVSGRVGPPMKAFLRDDGRPGATGSTQTTSGRASTEQKGKPVRAEAVGAGYEQKEAAEAGRDARNSGKQAGRQALV